MGWELHRRQEQAKQIWNKVDPDYKYVVYASELEQYAGEVDWLPSDFWTDLDSNNDGLVSAQEACFKAGGFTWECESLPNEEPFEPEWDQGLWEGFHVVWYRVDRNQDEIASFEDLRAVRDTTYSDDEVQEEFNYYDTDSNGEVGFYEAFAVMQKIQIRHNEFEEWFWSLNADGDEYLSSDELANDTKGIVENTDGEGQFHKDDVCKMWFTDIPLHCVEVTPTEEDIAPEDFIKGWYMIDQDHDEVISEDDFLSWASGDSFYDWMSTYEIKTQVWDPMSEGNSEATFAQGLAIYNTVDANMATVHTMWSYFDLSEEQK